VCRVIQERRRRRRTVFLFRTRRPRRAETRSVPRETDSRHSLALHPSIGFLTQSREHSVDSAPAASDQNRGRRRARRAAPLRVASRRHRGVGGEVESAAGIERARQSASETSGADGSGGGGGGGSGSGDGDGGRRGRQEESE